MEDANMTPMAVMNHELYYPRTFLIQIYQRKYELQIPLSHNTIKPDLLSNNFGQTRGIIISSAKGNSKTRQNERREENSGEEKGKQKNPFPTNQTKKGQ